MPTEPNFEAIIAYARQVRANASEAGRVAYFGVLLQQVFNDTPRTATDFTSSMERGVTFQLTGGTALTRRGRIDAMLGNVIIEFKTDLATGRETAKEELRSYAAGLCRANDLDDVPYTGFITDGLIFERYDLTLEPGKTIAKDNINVEQADSFELKPTPDSAQSFFWFIHRNLLQGRDREPTVEAFERDFGPTGQVFLRARRALGTAWAAVRERSEVGVARAQWAKYLQYAYGSKVSEGEEGDKLYIKHTYLACLAKFMVWAAFDPNTGNKDDTELVHDVISGEALSRMHVIGANDRDPFHWVLHPDAAKTLVPVWVQLLEELRSYSLRNLKSDVLKVLYEALVDPADRHELGEYYTPDWLCQEIVDDVLPKSAFRRGIPKVLDPTCGSGSFLVAVIRRMREVLAIQNAKADERAAIISEHVVGFDIHPLAVLVARANYLLALGDDFKNSEMLIWIPVFLADTMIDDETSREARPTLGFEAGISLEIGDPALERVTFPKIREMLARGYDVFITTAARIAEEIVRGSPLAAKTVEVMLDRDYPRFDEEKKERREATVQAVMKLGAQMGQLAKEGKDTIWSFVARNFYRPYLYARHFDVVVGNPPWLAFRYISNADYKKRLESFGVTRYGVCSEKSSLRTHTELATTFLLHACRVYLKQETGQIAFVLPWSISRTDQHEKLRAGPSGLSAENFRIEKVWDLVRVLPLFKVPACVLFASTEPRVEGGQPSFPGEVFTGRLSQREPSRQEARERLTRQKAIFHRINMGARTAWSADAAAGQFRSGPSPYADKFFQGATIVPRNAFFVKVHGDLPKSPTRTVHIETDLEQAKTAKAPWKSLRFKGEVERGFIFKSALAKHLLPFSLDGELPNVVLPLVLPENIRNNSPELLVGAQLKELGHLETGRYFETVEKAYAKHRKGAASKQTETLLQQLNYMNKLLGQDCGKRYVVLYATSGMNVVSTVLNRKKQKSVFVADAKTYRFETRLKAEAHYLAAILNAPHLNVAIKPFQSLGLLGERDIHKKVLAAPFPQFNPKNKTHLKLAALGERCAAIADKARATLTRTTTGARRTEMRVVLANELAEIDALVKELLAPE